MMGGMGMTMLLGVLLVAVVIGVAIYLAVRAGRSTGSEVEGARDALDRRLAAGDITPEDYYEREAALRSSQPAGGRRR